MSIHAITVVAGSEKLVAMTENMLEQFQSCETDESIHMTVINNGAARAVRQRPQAACAGRAQLPRHPRDFSTGTEPVHRVVVAPIDEPREVQADPLAHGDRGRGSA